MQTIKLRNKTLQVPIIQGGMGVGVSLGNLAGHVAKCGGMGVISTAHTDAGLDPEGRDKILQCISDLRENRGIGVVLVSHSMEDVANYADRIIVMNGGEVMYDDVPHKVFAHYRELEKVGLAAPQITYVMHELKKAGYNVDENIINLEEAKENILKCLGR